MSYSTWFSVDKFSDPRTDPHPIRLLTIIKETGAGQRLSLCIIVSARDKAMIVSTRESPLPAQGERTFHFVLKCCMHTVKH